MTSGYEGFKVGREQGGNVDHSYLATRRCIGFRYGNGKVGADAKRGNPVMVRTGRPVEERAGRGPLREERHGASAIP